MRKRDALVPVRSHVRLEIPQSPLFRRYILSPTNNARKARGSLIARGLSQERVAGEKHDDECHRETDERRVCDIRRPRAAHIAAAAGPTLIERDQRYEDYSHYVVLT